MFFVEILKGHGQNGLSSYSLKVCFSRYFEKTSRNLIQTQRQRFKIEKNHSKYCLQV